MIRELKNIIKNNQQAILYLNRRGFSPRIKCGECGHSPQCPHCDISLSYHKSGTRLLCHYCGYINSNYNRCEKCEGERFLYVGAGTQKVEEHLQELVPEARVVRLDSDSASARKKSHEILSDFAANKYNILLGTQMVSKGIDFPNVSLVGIMMADIGFDMPDFRAEEKLFAKLLQVSGRSGRGIIPGEVIIQTFNPESDLIDDAARQDYETFYKRTLISRRKLLYPPFARLINFRIYAKKETDCEKYALLFKNNLDTHLKKTGHACQLIGPAPSPLYRVREMYRRQMILKTDKIKKINNLLSNWQNEQPNFDLPPRVKLIIDIDPYDMM